MKTYKKVLLVLATLGLLAAAAWPVLAAEADTEAIPPNMNGRVEEVNPPYLTVTARVGSVLVLTDENTRFVVPGIEEPTLEDIHAGDIVHMRLGQDPEGRLLARLVAVIPAVEVQGAVIGKDGASLTVRTQGGEDMTLLTDEHTRYRVPGIEEPTLDDIQIGDLIQAGAVEQEDGSLLAKIIAVRAESINFRGKVTDISGNNVKIQTREGEVLAHTDDNTRYRVPGIEEPTLDDIHVGDFVAVVAYEKGEGDDSLWARLIAVIPAEMVRGEITGLDGTGIAVATPEAEISVLTDENTRYHIPGIAEPGYGDLNVGDRVTIAALVQEDGSLLARIVTVHPELLRFRGKVTEKGSAVFTIETRDGEETFLTDEHTRYRVPGVENPTLDDVQIGDLVGVAALETEGGALLARLVVVGPDVVRLDGDVTQIAGNNVKIQNPDGEVLVHTDENTRFIVPGIENPTIEDLNVGDHIHGVAEVQGEGSLWGRVLKVVDERKFTGQVSAIDGSNVTVNCPDGPITFATDENTRFQVLGIENPTLDDVQVGDLVFVVAFGQEDGSVLAGLVRVLPGVRFRGEVAAKEGAALTINTNKGPVVVLTDENTRYRVPGVEEPTLDDIHVGDQVGVIAVSQGESGLLAKGIGVLPQEETL